MSSWLTAVSPWAITESRLGYESSASLTITFIAFYLLFSYFNQLNHKIKQKKYIYISFLLLILATFIYAAQRVFIPLYLLFLIFYTLINKSAKFNKSTLIKFLILLSIIIIIPLMSSHGRGRAEEDLWMLGAKDFDRLTQVHVQAGISQLKPPVLATRFFHNKYRIIIISFLDRYFDHFSPSFLFFHGEASPQAIPDMGALSYLEIILFPLGLLFFLNDNKKSYLLFAWLALSPVASALTQGQAHFNRAVNMIPALAMISAFGAYKFYKFFHPKLRLLFSAIFIIAFIYSSLFTLNQIFVQKPLDHAWRDEQINRELTKSILNLKHNYQAVVVPDNNYIYYLFYGKITPQEFISNSDITPLTEKIHWNRVNRFDNIYFKLPYCPKSGKLNVLYVCKGQEIPQNSRIIKTIYYPDGLPGYNLIEFYPISQMPSNLPQPPDRIFYMVDLESSLNFPDGIIPDDYPGYW
jgi:hypothetical protein